MSTIYGKETITVVLQAFAFITKYHTYIFREKMALESIHLLLLCESRLFPLLDVVNNKITIFLFKKPSLCIFISVSESCRIFFEKDILLLRIFLHNNYSEKRTVPGTEL